MRAVLQRRRYHAFVPQSPPAATRLRPFPGAARLFTVALVTLGVFGFASLGWTGSATILAIRLGLTALALLLVFSLLERFPRNLPRWMERWALQVIVVALAVPFALAFAYAATSQGYALPFWKDSQRQAGFAMLLGLSLLVAPWTVAAALLRQITGRARTEALAFALERSELERGATQARLRLLQAQVEPHFLFNTLANVRELVESGSPQAAPVLASLIAYLRAAVPRLDAEQATLQQELELVRAYLEVMHMRMPDRLQWQVVADADAHAVACPPTAVLTLVENAVRHGIDPSEDGGRIEVRAWLGGGQLQVQVLDTGRGLVGGEDGLGTGLANLRERLRLLHGEMASLRLSPLQPHGVSAALIIPVPGNA